MRTASTVVAVFLLAPLAAVAGPRVDLNQDNGRGDVLSPGWDNWRVPQAASATAKFGGITVTIRAVGDNAKLTTAWWKPGFDYPARMASDGVVVAGKMELVLRGLPAGRHSLATYHNAFTAAQPNRIIVTGPGGASVTVTPTSQVKHDADAASAFLEFDAEAGKDVMLVFTPERSGTVVINGFEIDRFRPEARRCQTHLPFGRRRTRSRRPVPYLACRTGSNSSPRLRRCRPRRRRTKGHAGIAGVSRRKQKEAPPSRPRP